MTTSDCKGLFIREAGGYGWRASELEEELIAVRHILRETLKENDRLKSEVARFKGSGHGGTAVKLSALRR